MKIKRVRGYEPQEGAPPQNGLVVCPVDGQPKPCPDCVLMVGGIANAGTYEDFWVDSDTKSDTVVGTRMPAVTSIKGLKLCRHPNRWEFISEVAVAIETEQA